MRQALAWALAWALARRLTRAPWLHENTDGTLARALRGLQDHYEGTAATYRSHAEAMKLGRIQPKGESHE